MIFRLIFCSVIFTAPGFSIYHFWNQELPVSIRSLAMSRGDLSVIITWFLSCNLWTFVKGTQRERKKFSWATIMVTNHDYFQCLRLLCLVLLDFHLLNLWMKILILLFIGDKKWTTSEKNDIINRKLPTKSHDNNNNDIDKNNSKLFLWSIRKQELNGCLALSLNNLVTVGED